MAEQLQVVARDQHGKHHSRRLRTAGQIPAILYGHGQECVALAVGADEFEGALRRGSRLVDLTGAVNESAFVRQLQWDTYGLHVLHVDFTRISAHELVKVQVVVELRGEAPGVKDGGVVDQLLHQVEIECPAASIPDKLYVNVNHLKLDASIKLADLALPEKARAIGDPDAVVVQCMVPAEMPDELAPGEAVPGEPEVIGAKKEEAEEEG
jgi:large subunit ribosomal protein L25